MSTVLKYNPLVCQHFQHGSVGQRTDRKASHLTRRGAPPIPSVGMFVKSPIEIDTTAFKDLVGATRKWVIPLAEWFDKERVTIRVGEKRRLRAGAGGHA